MGVEGVMGKEGGMEGRGREGVMGGEDDSVEEVGVTERIEEKGDSGVKGGGEEDQEGVERVTEDEGEREGQGRRSMLGR